MSSSRHAEIETKYDVGIETPVPDLHGVKAVRSVSPPELTHPSSTYFDTRDFDLTRRRITLRRRTGSSDAGWHIKLPVSADERLEVRSPLSAGGNDHQVPDDVIGQVRALIRGKDLVPVAHIETRRTITRIATAESEHAAELCDDAVTAKNLLADTTTQWREWEVELVEGDRKILKKLDTYLLAHGAETGSSPSKLSRALGASAPTARASVHPPVAKSTAGEALLFAIQADIDGLLAADPRVREDEHDSVHAMRVATRRLRSVLRSYRSLLDRETVDAVRGELSWLADILGTARDAEVMAARYDSAIDALEPDLSHGDVVDRLAGTQRRVYELAHTEILEQLGGDRYFALLDSLDALVENPPFTPRAAKPARGIFRKVLRRQYDQVAADALAANADDNPDAVHEVRKSAKKLRYAAEPAALVLGDRAEKVGKAAKALQSVLGDYHDTAVSQDNIMVEVAKAREDGEDTFAYGVLYEREGHAGAEYLVGYPSARARLDRAARVL
ncbi:putative adenylate cyclase [Rhodococcoides trifolii]|uniref:Adenylate cyclase n=1 Tax=Rhodococcoides trifolii TaxID=908250 RepID=A0A917CZP6_9NOCA|nr:CYTH and CHAD domain-containing protein [Rhodococcus trifolii]GGG04880.1 putative adenylate cyclase [Rhodococcus trifolii]